jgi:hypothetical protein
MCFFYKHFTIFVDGIVEFFHSLTLPASQKNDHEKPINRKLNNYEYEI